MWLLFHHNARTRAAPGGRTLTEDCPTCQRTTKLDEIEITESVGMFFVDLVGDKDRAFRCRVCGDVFDLREPPSAAPAKPVDHAAEQRRRDDDLAAREIRIDDELAELKRRMGR